MTAANDLPLANTRIDFPAGSKLRSISLHPETNGTGWHIRVLPDSTVPAQAFQNMMNRTHDRVWGMAVHPPLARRAGQGVPGYTDIPAPTSMPLQADGSYLTASIPAAKVPAALALTLGILNKSIETPAESTGITAPLLSDANLGQALDGFNLHSVLQQIHRSLPPIGEKQR